MSRNKNAKAKNDKLQDIEYLEFVDNLKRPLGILSRETIHTQNLLHKSVQVLFFNKEKKLYIQQRNFDKDVYPGYWDVSAAGHVLCGESDMDASLRELKEELGINSAQLKLVHEISANYYTGYEFLSLFVSSPCSEIPKPNPEEVVQGFFVNKQEMDYLINFYSHLLTPGLLQYWKIGFLFPE